MIQVNGANNALVINSTTDTTTYYNQQTSNHATTEYTEQEIFNLEKKCFTVKSMHLKN